MLGVADIEGAKSNVAMNAWLPQARDPVWVLSGVGLVGSLVSRERATPLSTLVSSMVIPVVTFLTPLAEHFSDLKDR